ncbi:MAG TPA: DMT family transporter [Desulfomonilaceae bacterium]|nr:DMT family transporter [Desulfomonilaceae bacterium]
MNTNADPESNIPVAGVLFLVMLSFLWGANMVSIKISNQGVPPIVAAATRSVVASFLLWIYARYSSERVFLGREDLKHGIVIGVLFGLEFLLLYWGPNFTDVSRAVIFLYSHPFWVAVGAHFLLTNDRLTLVKTVGLCLAFAGLVLVFGSRSPTLGPYFWVGDLLELTAGLLWAATTIYVKKFIWNRPITHFQTLFAQLFFSIPVLVIGALIFEWGHPLDLKPLVVTMLFYQCVIVAFMSYLLWFWLIHRYPVSKLAAFTFPTPLFGVLLSGLLLGEAITFLLAIGLVLVAAGIYLVNRPQPGVE